MKKERSWLSKAIIFILLFLMIATVIISFLKGTPPYTISDEIVYIFGLIIVLLISDSIETFSIGNLITLKKKVQEKESEVTKLSTENRDLRNQISTIITASISNQNSTIIGFGDSFEKIFKVVPATEEDSNRDAAAEQETVDGQLQNNPSSVREHIPPSTLSYNRRRFSEQCESITLKKFIEKNDIPLSSVQREVKFSDQFIGCDPIMDRQMLFDAYIKRPLDEVFVELLTNPAGGMIDYRIYYMISKIYHYASANKTAAKLVLVLPVLPQAQYEELFGGSGVNRNQARNIERLKERFSPAIKNGLLEIVEIDISEKEYRAMMEQSK